MRPVMPAPTNVTSAADASDLICCKFHIDTLIKTGVHPPMFLRLSVCARELCSIAHTKIAHTKIWSNGLWYPSAGAKIDKFGPLQKHHVFAASRR